MIKKFRVPDHNWEGKAEGSRIVCIQDCGGGVELCSLPLKCIVLVKILGYEGKELRVSR